MNSIYEFITVFCSICLLFGGIYILKPTGNTAKTVKYIFSLIFVCVVLTAIFKIKNFDFSLKQNSVDYQISYDSLTESAITKTFSEALRSSNINFSKITVCTNKNDDGSISISKVTVISDEPKEKITEALGATSAEYEIEVFYE